MIISFKVRISGHFANKFIDYRILVWYNCYILYNERRGAIPVKVFVYCDEKGQVDDYDNLSAQIGFHKMGFEIVHFHDYTELTQRHDKADLIVSGIGHVKRRLIETGADMPDIDYPDNLKKYLGRKIWRSTINTINSSPELWPVFVKPVFNKRFMGRTVYTAKDLIGCGNCFEDTEVYCSEPIDLVSEYRCFVRYGTITDVRIYKGDWRYPLDPGVVEKAVADYSDQPKGYALDFGVTKNGRTLLVEVNATVCIGSYGLDPIAYAKLLSARWAELTGTEDECAFDVK